MTFRIRRKLVCDPEFLGLPPHVRETFITVFREWAVAEAAILKGSGWYIEELQQKPKVAPEGLFSVHVSDDGGRTWPWRGVCFRRGGDIVFFGFGPRTPEFYVKMARVREALGRVDDEH